MDKDFKFQVLNFLKKIPKGNIVTYKIVASSVNRPNSYRAVGSVLRGNLFPEKFPCYKVIKSNGEVGNYSGPGGQKAKQKILKSEGLLIKNNKIIDFQKYLFKIGKKRMP